MVRPLSISSPSLVHIQQESVNKINDKITEHISITKDLGNKILGKTEGTTVVVHNHYDHWWWPCYPSFHSHSYSHSSPSKNDKEGALITVAAIGIIYSVIRVAQSVGTLISMTEEISNATKFKKYFKNIVNSPGVMISSQKEINKIVNVETKIFSRMWGDAMIDLLLKGTLGVAAGIGIRGTTINNTEMAQTGYLVAAGAALAILFKWGLNIAETSNKKDANKLLKKIEILKNNNPKGVAKAIIVEKPVKGYEEVRGNKKGKALPPAPMPKKKKADHSENWSFSGSDARSYASTAV